MKDILHRSLWTEKPGSWWYAVIFGCIYAVVVYLRMKWGLVGWLPVRLRVRCLPGK